MLLLVAFVHLTFLLQYNFQSGFLRCCILMFRSRCTLVYVTKYEGNTVMLDQPLWCYQNNKSAYRISIFWRMLIIEEDVINYSYLHMSLTNLVTRMKLFWIKKIFLYKYVALYNSQLTHPLVHISGDAHISSLIMQYYTRMYRHHIQPNAVQTLLHPQGFLKFIN